MLRVIAVRADPAAVAGDRAGGRGDCDVEGLVVTGAWGGEGAGRLGLRGGVTREAFEALCRNRHPGTGGPLTPRTDADRRVGFDFTFNCPKSVSLIYGLTGDPELLAAFRAAVADTMSELEPLAGARVRRGGRRAERRTGNLVHATFIHTTARPVGGYPDPHLHCHAFVLNATWDGVEGRWKAVELGTVAADLPYFQAGFHARLAANVAALGFDVSPTRTGWEVAGVPGHVLQAFSRRTAQVEHAAAALGVTSAEGRDGLGARTREKKGAGLAAEQLRTKWWSVLGPDARAAVQAVLDRRLDLPAADPRAARDALSFAARHCFERRAVVPVGTLLAAAMRRGVGRVTPATVLRELAASELLVRERDGRSFVTSPEVLREEQRILAFARSGRGACRPVAGEGLSAGQRVAVEHVLTSGDRVVLVRGAAGTGKTALMRAAVGGVEAAGFRVVPLAPTAAASRGVLRGDEFASADTVARFLADPAFREAARGQFLWVDEAGLLSTRSAARLFALAGDLGARVVLAGDSRQHAGVERGSALELLQKYAGLPVAEVTGVRRQAGRYREAARLLGAGKTLAGFDALARLGWVVESAADDLDRWAADLVLAGVADRKSVLLVSPTHAEGERVTARVRESLQAAGQLGSDERTFPRLVSRGLTAAERTDPASYEVGDVVEHSQNAPGGFVKGGRHAVVSADGGSVVVADPAGRVRALGLEHPGRFEVYAPRELVLSVGDRVRVTRNDRAADGRRRLDNGGLHTVAGFTPEGGVLVADGRVIPGRYAHLAHGYVVTSYAAQGRSVDRVVVVQTASSFPASGREQFYVSVTRGRESATVLTDDAAGLRRAVEKSDPRTSATELLGPSATHPAWAAWLARRARGVRRLAGRAVGGPRPVHPDPGRQREVGR